MDEVRKIALAIAAANRHPEPEAYADAVCRAYDGGEAWPEEGSEDEASEPVVEKL